MLEHDKRQSLQIYFKMIHWEKVVCSETGPINDRVVAIFFSYTKRKHTITNKYGSALAQCLLNC